MLAFAGLIAAVVFLILWSSGALDDLRSAAARRRARPKNILPERKAAARRPEGPPDRRLEVFERFLDKLSDDDDPGT